MKTLPVYETFYTWQGEGCHMGKPAFFIRLFGCPVHCPWCDSAGTWHPDHIPDKIDKYAVDALLDQALSHPTRRVVITGGEPCIHDLSDLTNALRAAGCKIHLETSGAFPIRGSFDWITVSPKIWKEPLLGCLEQADEFKLIVDSLSSIDRWEAKLGHLFEKRSVWLHPEWSKREDEDILKLINRKVMENKFDYRAGYQLHKLYGVDEEAASAHKRSHLLQ